MMLVPPCPAKAFPQRCSSRAGACELWDKTLTAPESVAHVSFVFLSRHGQSLVSPISRPTEGNGVSGLKPNGPVEGENQSFDHFLNGTNNIFLLIYTGKTVRSDQHIVSVKSNTFSLELFGYLFVLSAQINNLTGLSSVALFLNCGFFFSLSEL